MSSIRRPVAYGLAVAVGALVGGVVLGDAAIASGLTLAITAFVVMFVLKLSFDR